MTSLRIALYCVLGGLCLAIPAMGAGHFALWWVSGALISASFVPLARFGPRNPLAQFGAIFLALFVVGSVCTISEAILFFPEKSHIFLRNLAGSLAIYAIAAAALALLAKLWKRTDASAPAVERRSWGMVLAMVLVSGIAYVVYYLVFGGITYQFFTRQYYPHAMEITSRLGLWFWAIELARGVVMTLAVLPIIYTLRMRRWSAALAVGVLVWIVGGGAGLLLPNEFMVTVQRYIHIVEIMTQNVSLGITAVLLLRPRAVLVRA